MKRMRDDCHIIVGREMDHTEAVRRQAAEKYLLGELTDRETEEFEQHYFECGDCASDLEAGALFVDNAKAVIRQTPGGIRSAEPASLKRPRFFGIADFWRRPLVFAPALTAAALATICVYQAFVLIPGLKHTVAQLSSPHAVPEFPLLEVTRGEPGVITIPPGALTIDLRIEPAWAESFPRYRFDLTDSAGARRATWEAPAPESGQAIVVAVSPRSLGQERAAITVSGIRADGSVQPDLATYRFPFVFR